MKVLIVSDSHGRDTYLELAIEKASPFDMLIHLGDVEGSEYFLEEVLSCPMEIVAGNNDFFAELEREKIVTIGTYHVLLTHGHRYQVYSGTERIKEYARQNGVDIVMFGHTHMPVIDQSSDVIALNPGSISQPRQKGYRPSYMIWDLNEKKESEFKIYYL